MKKIKKYSIDDDIPSNASFLCKDGEDFFFTLPQKTERDISEEDKKTIERVINYLNKKLGLTGRKGFKSAAKASTNPIMARINEGREPEDFKAVIDIQYHKWSNDPEMAHHLNPTTLFGTKFDKYLAGSHVDENLGDDSSVFEELEKYIKRDK